MDIKKRVENLYKNLRLSKIKTEFHVIKKGSELPELKQDVIQVLLII